MQTHKGTPKRPTSLAGRVLLTGCAALVAALIYRYGSTIGVPDYPSDWPRPRLLMAGKGDCPDLSGRFDGVDDVVPRILQGQPAWIQGNRGWFEHQVQVTQADDGSWLEFRFALNERGLPAHRQHVMNYNQDWPHGSVLRLTQGAHYRCSGRWLYASAGHEPFMSKDRAGNLIIGETSQVSGKTSFFNLSFGPESVDKTRWYRWSARPAQADAKLASLYSLEVNRYPWTNRNGAEVVVKVGNYLGKDLCVRLWDQRALQSDPLGGNAPVADGRLDASGACPSHWRRLDYPGSVNYFLQVRQAAYRLAWFAVGAAASSASTRDLPDPAALPLMPDPNAARRTRARQSAPATPAATAPVLATTPADDLSFAPLEVLKTRLQASLGSGGSISELTIDGAALRVSGVAQDSPQLSQWLRRLHDSGGGIPDLLSIKSQGQQVEFVLSIPAGKLTAPD